MLFLRKLKIVCLFFVLFIQSYANQPMVLGSCLGAGFFAELQRVVCEVILIAFNEPMGGELEVQWTQEFFPYKNDKNENGWPLFFHPIGHVYTNRGINHGEIRHDQTCINKWLNYDNFYNYRLGMHKIINRHIKIKEEILNEADDFYNTYMNNKVCIGVHVRFAGAHNAEKPGPLGLGDYFSEIDALIKKIEQKYILFLATDSKFVVNQFKERYNDSLVYCDAIRSDFDSEVHIIYSNADYWMSHPDEFHARKPGYKGGKDALIDCLLLSKCSYLIHTTSNVSDFATFFNPDIQSIFVPKHITEKVRTCSACNSSNKWYNADL